MEARHLMSAGVFSVSPDQSIEDAHHLMLDKVVRHVPVVAEQKLVGMLSDRDVLLVAGRDAAGHFVYPPLTVAQVMSASPAVARPGVSVAELARRMIDSKFGALPIVTEEGEVLGLVTSTDLLRFVSQLPHQDAHRAGEATLAAVRSLVKDGGFQSAAKRLGELRLEVERRLDTEGRLVPLFIERTGDPGDLAHRLRDAHDEVRRRLSAAANAVTAWDAPQALRALDVLAAALTAHRALEADLLRSPAMKDLVSGTIDWERLRFQLAQNKLA